MGHLNTHCLTFTKAFKNDDTLCRYKDEYL